MTNPTIDEVGNKKWYDENGRYHREDGPAIIYLNGYEIWLRHGKHHRLDGPAIIWSDGGELWYVNDKLIDINPILERFEISPDWRNWTNAEKMIVRLALP